MLSKTLQEGLNDYGIGAKIRALRLKKKIGLVDLGKHTGLSPALLSKIERGRLFPTLPTLLRIALVFGVGLEFFFAGARDQPLVAVTRKNARVDLPERPGALTRFLAQLHPDWNVSLFHYRNQGADHGHILVGLQVPPAEHALFQQFLATLGYPHRDESANPAYRLLLCEPTVSAGVQRARERGHAIG